MFKNGVIEYLILLLSTQVIQADRSKSPVRQKPVSLLNLSNNFISYQTAWDYQKRLLQYHVDKQDSSMLSSNIITTGSLLVLQHSPVYTLGTGTQQDSGPFHSKIEDNTGNRVVSYDTVTVERAGQATYHGPGQLVMYPILDLNYFEKDINLYLRNLEQVVIDTCADYSLVAGRVEGQTGVWIDQQVKISALGIKLRRWVTMHGISVNVNPNLKHFSNIIPCGITDKSVGSITQYITHATLNEVNDRLLHHFCRIFKTEFVSEYKAFDALSYLDSLPHVVEN